jgi:hypothetical protein
MRRNFASDDCFRLASRLRPRVLGRRSPRAEKVGGSALSGALFVAVLWASACDSKPPFGGYTGNSLTPPGPGVIFSYPRDGQYDVPVGTRLVLTFSDALPELTLTECAKSGEQVTGAFCVEGPDGFVKGAPTASGPTLAFAPAGGFAPGATYRVYARPALLNGSTNLPEQAPLLTFHTRSTRALAGKAAAVVTVNGSPRAADGSIPGPFLDAAPIRLLFSEPLDPSTVTGETVRLLHSADQVPVDGVTIAQGIHLTFQPSQTLRAGEAYELSLSGAVRDSGGEAIAPVSLQFTARRTAAPSSDLFPLSLGVQPAWTDGASQPASGLAAMPVNSNRLSSQLVGDNTLGVLAGGLDTLLGDPQIMGTPIPMIIRRGQRLELSSMPIRFGGVLEAGLKTGKIHFTMLTDAIGFMLRNPFRGPDEEPDDKEAPAWVQLTMDALISSEDSQGNTLSSQTVLGIQVLGTSTLDVDQLAIDQVGALEFSLLGLTAAPVNLAMRLRTTSSRAPTPDLETPYLISSFPANGAKDISPEDPVELNFSRPLDPSWIRDGYEVMLVQGGTRIPATTRLEGTTLIVTPSRRLSDAALATLSYSGLRSLNGVAIQGGALSFTTAEISTSQPAPPVLVALSPGAPCALTGGNSTSPGHCAGGQTGDSSYQVFTLPANRDIRAVFSQPMDPATLTLGTACGQGSIRVESIGANGQCNGVVAGTLLKRDREIRFTPNQPWTRGAAYRLTLVGGGDNTCGAGEICGRNAQPLNTDPLSGAKSDGGGGPDVVIGFTGAPATVDTFLPLSSDVVTDLNGNGFVDPGERPSAGNSVAMEVAGVSGIVTRADLLGADCLPSRPGQQVCSYLSATLPSSVKGVLPNCPVDAQGQPSSAANPCVEVQVFPSAILGTSITMDTTALAIIRFDNVPTGMQIMRLSEMDGPIYGYIMREAGIDSPQFVIRQNIYFDAPNLSIPVASHDLKSKPLSMTLKGPVGFRPDGRMEVALRNVADVQLSVNISSLGTGAVNLRIPAGEMRITLAGPLLR